MTKDQLIDKYRDINTELIDWWDSTYEDFKSNMDTKGAMSHRIHLRFTPMKIINKDARKFVWQRLPFQGSNLFAQVHTRNSEDGASDPDTWYVVYSYGVHLPLFICANGTWFENEDRHSVTTSKHRSQTHPHCPTILLSTEWMKKLAQGGYQALVKARVKWDCIYSDFREQMADIGIHVEQMYFSGFSSQGDGACFEGQVSDWGLFLKSLGITNDVLVEFACNHWSFSVKQNCTAFSADIPSPDGEDDEWFIERYSPYRVDDFRSVVWLAVLRGFDFSSMKDTFRDAFKDHMRQLYKVLEAECDYRTSDEAVWESIVANELDDELEETCD